MNTQEQNRASELAADEAVVADVKPMSRRVMLRGAAAAVPAVLTLHSGSASALARSSNMLSVTNELIGDGPAMCLDVTSLKPVEAGATKYDLGSDPRADITSIPDRKYYRGQNLQETVSRQEMCREGGTYYYKSDAQLASLDTAEKSDDSLFGVRRSVSGKSANEGLTEGRVTGKGAFVSATALKSFVGAAGINIRNI